MRGYCNGIDQTFCQPGWGYVFPVGATVSSQVDKPVVTACPDRPFFVRRLRDVTQRGLAGEATPAEIGGAWGGAAMLGLGGVEGLERGGRMLPGGAASRAAQLAKDMKFSEGVQAERAGVAADPLNQATAIRRGTVVPRGNASASTPYVPGQGPSTVPPQGEGIGIAPKFEEDVMPRAMEPTQGAAYPVGGGVHPELQQLYDDVLGPAKEAAPQPGAGFRAIEQTRRAKSRAGRYRQSEDDTGGQPS